MNKYNLFGIVAVAGILLTTFGAWAKITHQAYADTAITMGMCFDAVGIAALVWFVFMWLKNKNSNY